MHNTRLKSRAIALCKKIPYTINRSKFATQYSKRQTMTLIEAIELGYIHRQGRYKGAPWICNGKQYRTSKEALAAANASMLRHSPLQ